MKMRYEMTEEQKAEIADARRRNKDKRIERRLRVLQLRGEGKTLAWIAEATGFHRSHVSSLIAAYFREGIGAITDSHYQGNRRNMSIEEEAELLEPYLRESAEGHILDTREIKAAYEAKLGRPVGSSQIYYVLKRHGWRKVMPRSKHPNKASDEVIEASKKLKLGSRD